MNFENKVAVQEVLEFTGTAESLLLLLESPVSAGSISSCNSSVTSSYHAIPEQTLHSEQSRSLLHQSQTREFQCRLQRELQVLCRQWEIEFKKVKDDWEGKLERKEKERLSVIQELESTRRGHNADLEEKTQEWEDITLKQICELQNEHEKEQDQLRQGAVDKINELEMAVRSIDEEMDEEKQTWGQQLAGGSIAQELEDLKMEMEKEKKQHMQQLFDLREEFTIEREDLCRQITELKVSHSLNSSQTERDTQTRLQAVQAEADRHLSIIKGNHANELHQLRSKLAALEESSKSAKEDSKKDRDAFARAVEECERLKLEVELPRKQRTDSEQPLTSKLNAAQDKNQAFRKSITCGEQGNLKILREDEKGGNRQIYRDLTESTIESNDGPCMTHKMDVEVVSNGYEELPMTISRDSERSEAFPCPSELRTVDSQDHSNGVKELREMLAQEVAKKERAEAEIATLNDQADNFSEQLMELQAENSMLALKLRECDSKTCVSKEKDQFSSSNSQELFDSEPLDDDSSPLLDEALALAHGLTDLLHESKTCEVETSVMDILETFQGMIDQSCQGDCQSQNAGTEKTKASEDSPFAELFASHETSDSPIIRSPPKPVLTPVLATKEPSCSVNTSSHFDVDACTEKLLARCQKLESERKEIMESTLDTLQANRRACKAEVEAAVATVQKEAAEELISFQERIKVERDMVYNTLCSHCRHNLSMLSRREKVAH